jgi:hypothetical protein
MCRKKPVSDSRWLSSAGVHHLGLLGTLYVSGRKAAALSGQGNERNIVRKV